MARTYWGNHPEWQRLDSRSKAAAMALLEADARDGKIDLASAKNALGAMINRSARDGVDIGEHVSGKIYQPTIEPAQFQRLKKIVGSPEHQELMKAYDARVSGQAPDWVNGATHFLAPEQTMLALESRDPQKYRSWRSWTGFDDKTGAYKGVMLRDQSHAFLAPEGPHSATFNNSQPYQSPEAGSTGAQPGASPALGGGMLAGLTGSPQTPTMGAPAPAGGGLLEGIFPGASSGAGASTPSFDAGEAGKGGLLAGLIGDDTAKKLNAFGDKLGGAGATLPGMGQAAPAAPDMKSLMSMGAQRQPIDMQRVMAVLQARSRLGSA